MVRSLEEALRVVVNICLDAGSLAMTFVEKDIKVEQKADASPVTVADKTVNEFLVTRLKGKFPEAVIIAEEDKEGSSRRDVEEGKDTFYVDPIDGTKEFIKGNGEWSVMVGMVRNEMPVLGCVYHPPSRTLYCAATGFGSYRVRNGEWDKRERIQCNPRADLSGCTLVRSRSHPNTGWAAHLEEMASPGRVVYSGSFGLKLAMIADGRADFYVNNGNCCLWDSCAGTIIATEAGAIVGQVPPGSRNVLFIRYVPWSLRHKHPIVCTTSLLMATFTAMLRESHL